METEEAQIAQGLRRRDPELLDALIEQYQHRLLRYLLHLTGNRAVAEDLFQEVWVRVLEKGPSLRRPQSLRYLAHVDRPQRGDRLPAQTQSRQPRRDAGRRGRRALRAAGRPGRRRSTRPRRASSSEIFDEALEHVSPLFREVLVLRFQEQMKLEEIAKLIRIPVATVKTRIYRGVNGAASAARCSKEAHYDEP